MSHVYLCFAEVPDAEASGSGDESPLKGAVQRASARFHLLSRRIHPPAQGWLTPREAALFVEIKSPQRRRDWLAGRCAAKELIRSYLLEREGLALACSQIEILNDENKAPRISLPLSLELNFQLSIAHSGGHGLAGLCPHSPPGVDLQQIRPVRPDLVERVLTERERAQLAQHFNASIEGALVFWALKEAAIKAQRARPAPAFREITVRLREPGHAEILLRSQRLQAQWGRWKEFIWAWATP